MHGHQNPTVSQVDLSVVQERLVALIMTVLTSVSNLPYLMVSLKMPHFSLLKVMKSDHYSFTHDNVIPLIKPE